MRFCLSISNAALKSVNLIIIVIMLLYYFMFPVTAYSIIICSGNYVINVLNAVFVRAFHRYSDVTKFSNSKPGGLQNFYLHLRKDYLKIYLFTIPLLDIVHLFDNTVEPL